MYPNYSRVRLRSGRFQEKGVFPGDFGYIVEVWDEDNFEVEFSDEHGITISQVTAHKDELELAEPAP